MTFLQRRRATTRSIIPFRSSFTTMRCRMLGSVFNIGTFYAGSHSSMCISLQVPPALGHGQPEGHHEDIPLPVGGVAGPGRVQDLHHINNAHQGIVDYHPQPLAVGIFHLTATGIDDIRAIGPCIRISRCGSRTCARCSSTSSAQCSSGYRFLSLIYVLKTFHCR
jgi:hypothetical protein